MSTKLGSLKRKRLQGKETGTKNIISSINSNYSFSSDFYIVFSSNVYEVAKNRFRRWNYEQSNNFKAIDVNGLFQIFFN